MGCCGNPNEAEPFELTDKSGNAGSPAGKCGW